jgi:hypothetical protein
MKLHSRVFILDLPTNIDLWNLYYFFLAWNWAVSSLYDFWRKCGNAWKLVIYDGLWIPRIKGGNLLNELYSLRNLYINYLLDFRKYFLSVNTNSVLKNKLALTLWLKKIRQKDILQICMSFACQPATNTINFQVSFPRLIFWFLSSKPFAKWYMT